MIILGVDPHKRTHTAVAVDATGRQQAQTTVAARRDGHGELIAWARRLDDSQRVWAVEDCRGVTGRLEGDLLAAGERVVRVAPHLSASARARLRTRGKSDAIDALAVARVALAEPDLPAAGHDPASLEVKLLADHREDLVAQRTQVANRLRWELHQLVPELEVPKRSAHTPAWLARITTALHGLPAHPDPCAGTRRRVCAELVTLTEALNTMIQRLEADLARRVDQLAPRLRTLQGVGVLTAAKLIGETANPTRFASADRYAAYTGTAPIPASSGRRDRHRLNRGGNRQLNAALYRIAITQTSHPGPGQDYYRRRQTQGKTKRDALRALKRHLARVVFRLLLADYHTRTTPHQTTA